MKKKIILLIIFRSRFTQLHNLINTLLYKYVIKYFKIFIKKILKCIILSKYNIKIDCCFIHEKIITKVTCANFLSKKFINFIKKMI